MTLSELKNVDVGGFLKGLLTKNSSINSPRGKMILWGVLGALVAAAYVAFVFMPYLAKRDQIQKKMAAVPEMEAKIKYLDVANKKAREDLTLAEMNYLELNSLFSVESELEELYQHLSQIAASQGLVFSALSTGGEEAIYAGGKTATPGQKPNAAAGAAPAPTASALFYRIKLNVELTGNYSRYMRYRKLLAGFEKSVNIDKEQITLVSGDTHGVIRVKSQISTYRLPGKLQTKPASLGMNVQGGHFFRVAAQQGAPAGNPGVKKNEGAVLSDNLDAPRPNERNPFSKSSSGMIEGGRDPRYSPLLMADPQSYVITGVVVSNVIKVAMIRTDFKESYVVKVGDRLGNQGGIISDIDLDGIILRQPGGGIRLYLQSQGGQLPAIDPIKTGGAR